MKRCCGVFAFVGVLLATSCSFLPAGVTFGSRDSAIKIAAGARLNVGSSNLIVDGTLRGDEGAEFSGQPVTFDNGLLSSGGLEAVMQGQFDPAGTDYVRLQGSGSFRAEPGTLLQGMTVEGSLNRIEGQPLFQSPISLADASTDLTLALQSALNQNIVLNGGFISLDDNLSLNDNVQIIGPGSVYVNKRQLRLGSVYASPWATDIAFDNAADIVLNGKVAVTGVWTFSGTSCLSGNGMLDLSAGGQIVVDNGATLIVDGVHITGLGNSAGQLVLNNAASTIRSSGSTFEFVDALTINNGTFYAEGGPTTFLTAANNVTFAGTGQLTVDGTTVWLDSLDMPSTPGKVLGTLDLTNHGTVKSLSGGTTIVNNGGRDPATETLIHTTIVNNVTIDQNVYLGPDEKITASGSGGVIDGSGMTIQFSDQAEPQFIVQADSAVTLQNITLEDINQNTFDLRDNSTIIIGDNVTWYMDEDITFSHGIIRVSNGVDGANVWLLRGETTRRKFALAPMSPILPSGQIRKMLLFGHNTVQLESTELSGFTYMSFASSDGIDPAVALSRNAGVDINVDTAMNFFTEGTDNDLILRKDGLTLSGGLLFGDLPDNRLRARFSLATPFDDTQAYRSGVQANYPVLQISGGPGIFLTSEFGLAELDFLDTRAALRLKNSNAFIAEANSLLTYNHLQVIDNPISQMSRYFRTDGNELIGSIDASGARRPTRSRSFNVPVCALQLKRQKARDDFERAKAAAAVVPQHKPFNKPLVKPVPKQHVKTRGLIENVGDDDTLVLRDMILPTVFDAQPVGQLLPQTAPLNGNIRYERCKLTNVTVSATTAFNILLDQGSSLTQGSSAIVLQSSHIINARGTGNVIYVTGTFQLSQGNLNLAPGAELTFVFVNNGSSTPQVVITDGTIFDIETSAGLKFVGDGSVVLGDGVVLNLKGTKTTEGVVTARSQLLVGSSAIMSVRQGGTARIKGIGSVEVAASGRISVGTLARLIVGLETPTEMSTGADQLSDINWLVHDDGELFIEGNGTDRGLISFCYGKSSLRFEDRGKLLIYDGGTLELGVNNGTAVPARMTQLSFGRDGLLFVKGSGLLSVGSNYFDTLTAQPYPFAYDGRSSEIKGDGLVGFVTASARTPGKSFTGRLNPTAAAYLKTDAMTSEKLVQILVNTISTLKVSIQYINAQCQNVVRTKNGVSVTLQDGESAVSDNATTGVVTCQNSQGEIFTIAANGTRS